MPDSSMKMMIRPSLAAFYGMARPFLSIR
jgi:hypothetical protein